MIEDLAFVLIHHVETSQLICSTDHLSGFYLVHVIERNFRTTCGFFIVILTNLLCLYLIGSLWSVFFYTCYSVTDQGVLNYSFSKMPVKMLAQFFSRLQYKKMFEPTFSHMYFSIESQQYSCVNFYVIGHLNSFKT